MAKHRFNPIVRIDSFKIGDTHPTFIIAEAGSNHNRNLSTAKRMVKVASSAAASAVKFQLFTPEKIYAEGAGSADYLKNKQSISEILKKIKMPESWLSKLAEECKKQKILFLCSAFDEEAVDLVDPFVYAHKIASYEITHLPLIKYIAKKRKPIILSTAMATLDEIALALETIASTGNRNVILMHCIACYPAPLEASNLNAIPLLKRTFQVPVGLSDHSTDPVINPIVNTSLGGHILEKHFTLDRSMDGPDHKYAIEPDELSELVAAVRGTEAALGQPIKKCLPIEKELYHFARRHVHAIDFIKKGQIFSIENIAILRSGKLPPGLDPEKFEVILGKRASKDISLGKGITKEMMD